MIALAMLYIIGQALAEPPPVCAPPPKITVTVPCAPDEGCVEKWIFVDPEVPSS